METEEFRSHIKLEDGTTVRFVPPPPEGDRLGGITQAERESLTSLKDEIAEVNNTTEIPVAAGKVWTSTADGAEWKTPTGGGGGLTWKTVQDVTINEEVAIISVPFTDAYSADGVPNEIRVYVGYVPSATDAPTTNEFLLIGYKPELGTTRGFKTHNCIGKNETRIIAEFFPIFVWKSGASVYYVIKSKTINPLQTNVASADSGAGFNYIINNTKSIDISSRYNVPFGVGTRIIVEVLM